jgi:hypothetical protein
MDTRHVATAALGLTLLLGACGSGPSGSKASTGTTAPAPATPVTTVAASEPAGSPVTVRTDDLDAQLRAVDGELGGAQQSVNQANDTSPDTADD